MIRWLFVVHFAATWYLVGLCWLVQRVQYPLMARVGRPDFAAYAAAHVDRIGPVVAPAMLVEAGTAILLVTSGAAPFRGPWFGLALVLLLAIWLSTFLVQVPLHGALRRGFEPGAHGRLVATNWARTLAWSARGILLVWLMASGAAASDASAIEPGLAVAREAASRP